MSWKKQSSRSNTGKNTFINSNYSLSSTVNSENSRILGKGLFDNDVDICGNLTTGGEFTAPTIIVDNYIFENLVVTNKLDVSGVTIENKLDVSGVDISYNLFVGGNLDVSGDFVFDNNLDVSGMDISYNLFVGGNLDVSGDVVFRGIKLDVSGVDISNNLSVAGKLFLESETITVGDGATISSTSAPGTVYNPEKSTVVLECLVGEDLHEQQEFIEINPGSNDSFGWSVDISEDGIAIVGAPKKNNGGTEQGSAYIYHKDGIGWPLPIEIKASNAADGDHFGYSVAISGTGDDAVIIVGAPLKENSGKSQMGSIYIFDTNGVEVYCYNHVGPYTVSLQDKFGYSVAISGTGNDALAVVGAPGGTADYPYWEPSLIRYGKTGIVFIFRRPAGTWSPHIFERFQDYYNYMFGTVFSSPPYFYEEEFGYSVAISPASVWNNGLVIIGAPKRDAWSTPLGPWMGVMYIFDLPASTGVFSVLSSLASDAREFEAPSPHTLQYFGWSVAITGTLNGGDDAVAIVGAWGANPDCLGYTDQGGLFIYERIPGTNTWNIVSTLKIGCLPPPDYPKFGYSVAISGTGSDAIAIVGAPEKNWPTSTDPPAGAVYKIDKSSGNWAVMYGSAPSYPGVLVPNNLSANAMFGHSVAISGNGNIAIIGGWERGTTTEGSAYIFDTKAGPNTPAINWDLSTLHDCSYQELNIFYDASQNPYLKTQINFGTDNLGTSSGLGSNYLFDKNGQSLSIMNPFTESATANGKWRIMNTPANIESVSVLEEFHVFCQGQTVSTIKGNVSIENVTATVTTNQTYTDIPGSTITYTPPYGTTQVTYQYTLCMEGVGPSTLAFYKFFIDNVEQTCMRNQVFNHGDMENTIVCPILIGHAANIDRCTVPDWTSPKTLKMQVRSWDFSYYSNLFQTNFVPGNGAAGPQQVLIFVSPMIHITASRHGMVTYP